MKNIPCQINKIYFAVSCNEHSVVIPTGCFLFRMDVYSKNSMTTRWMLVHIMCAYCAISEAYSIIEFLHVICLWRVVIMIVQYKFYIHIVPSSSTATRSSNSSHSIEKRLSTTNALLFLFHLTLRFDLLGPGFNKSITYKDTKVKTYQLWELCKVILWYINTENKNVTFSL